MFFYVDALWHLSATQLVSVLVVTLASLIAIAWSTNRAIRTKQTSIRPGSSEAALIGAAWEFHRTGCKESAVATFADALKIDPNSIEALKGRSLCHSEMGDYNQAMRDVHEWVLRAPTDGDAYLHRARLWKQLGLDDMAVSDLRSALKHSTSNATAREAVQEMARISFGADTENNPVNGETKSIDDVAPVVPSQLATACDQQRSSDEAVDGQQELTLLPPPPPSDSGHSRSAAAGVPDHQAHPA